MTKFIFKSVLSLIFFFSITTKVLSEENKIIFLNEVSQLPIHVSIPNDLKANLIAIIGGKGLKNKHGKSKNFLKRNKSTFVRDGLAFFLFPNFSYNEKASYKLRGSSERTKRILSLVKYIKTQNDKPIFLIGFSRGSIDVGVFSLKYPSTINGVIIASGIYDNKSKKAKNFSMEKIIGNSNNVKTLIVHHKLDTCRVTKYEKAILFFKNLNSPDKTFLNYLEGNPSGRECGPYHYHGYEGIETQVTKDITSWILSKVN